jgi:hypothetical protein
MIANRIEPTESPGSSTVERTWSRLQFSIRRMMQIVVGLAFLFALITITQRNLRRASLMEGRSRRCISNLHNVVLGVLGYQADNGVFPAGTVANQNLDPESRLSWYALILPHMDHEEDYAALEKDRPWNLGQNDVFAHGNRHQLWCPHNDGIPPGGPAPTYYVGIAGLGKDAPTLPKSDARAGVFGYDRTTTLADITDGTANSLLIAETARISGSWLQGGNATIRGLDPAGKPYIGPGGQFGGLHPHAGAWVAMADGSVRWIDASINPTVFEGLSTMAGGERLPKDW